VKGSSGAFDAPKGANGVPRSQPTPDRRGESPAPHSPGVAGYVFGSGSAQPSQRNAFAMRENTSYNTYYVN
jgi:hypothetical protein